VPKPLQYKNGSLIYARGEEADKIYILQNGKISLVYQDIETGVDVRDQVQTGEFFGVKSALGHFPREENAIAVADSSVLAITIPEFESMALANTKIVLKMLKVFSTQMRRIHTQVSKLTESTEAKPDEGLFAIGERYLKLKRYSHAKYVFSRYLEIYPTGRDAAQATKNLQLVEVSLALANDKTSASGAKGGKS
jgi:CRP-like cAMP-binding protein